VRRFALLILALAVLSGADCEERRLSGLDNGRIHVDDADELVPIVLPFGVIVDTTTTAPDLVQEAMAWWLAQVNVDGVPRDLLYLDEESSEGTLGTVTVTTAQLPPTWDGLTFHDDGGDAQIDYNAQGEILRAVIVLNVDYNYDRATTLTTLKHELGHAPFGLADDEDSLDLNSIMSDPTPQSGVLTEQDRGLILGGAR